MSIWLEHGRVCCIKRPLYESKTHFMGKKESVSYFTFAVVLIFDFFKCASLCNLIKLVNILRKYAASEQKRF